MIFVTVLIVFCLLAIVAFGIEYLESSEEDSDEEY